ncbi:diaminopimelate epimerase [Candidatus Bathyarchaeota archaeon]|nr:diaminopimelate epimerase [Candidatus Bathyarchaeota archaeon]
MKFWKMHGLGNDYIVIDNTDDKLNVNPSVLAKELCRRRFSVGADGLILACKSSKADVKMRIFNADGSEAEMCGNGIRCLAKFCYEKNIVKKSTFNVETLAGIKTVWLSINENNEVEQVRVNMGKPSFNRRDIPMLGDGDFINEWLNVNNEVYQTTCLSIGNPHCVIFVDDVSSITIEKIGPKLEKHEIFPKGTNVEFVQVINPNEIKVRVWERGVGETLACGTGACASAIASHILGKTNKKVKVKLLGGTLEILYDGAEVFMEGSATKVFVGELF